MGNAIEDAYVAEKKAIEADGNNRVGDPRYDFGVSLAPSFCTTCNKLTRNKGDMHRQQVFCVPCYLKRDVDSAPKNESAAAKETSTELGNSSPTLSERGSGNFPCQTDLR